MRWPGGGSSVCIIKEKIGSSDIHPAAAPPRSLKQPRLIFTFYEWSADSWDSKVDMLHFHLPIKIAPADQEIAHNLPDWYVRLRESGKYYKLRFCRPKKEKKRNRSISATSALPLRKTRLRSFPGINSGWRKWTSTEAAVTAEVDAARARRKAGKELKIKRKYEAELAPPPSPLPPLTSCLNLRHVHLGLQLAVREVAKSANTYVPGKDGSGSWFTTLRIRRRNMNKWRQY